MRRALAAAAVLLAGLVLVMPGASADAPDVTGWWAVQRTTPPSLGVPVPPPQAPSNVPPGGLYVAGAQPPVPAVNNAASGADAEPEPVAVSAVRFAVPANGTVEDLVLAFHEDDGDEHTTGTVAVQACPSPIRWEPAEGGSMNTAPPWDCSQGLALGVPVEGGVRIPVSGLVRDGELNVVLLPQPGTVFEAVFAKPGDDAIAVTRRSTTTTTTRPSGPNGGCNDCAPSTTLPPPPEQPWTGPVGGGVALPPPVVDDDDLPATREPARPIVADDDSLFGDGIRVVAGWKRALAGAVAACLAALYTFLMRLPKRPPRLIGGFAHAARRRT